MNVRHWDYFEPVPKVRDRSRENREHLIGGLIVGAVLSLLVLFLA